MTALSIARLTATLPESLGEHGLAARAEGMLADATGRRLDESLAACPLPAGHWFLRRLALKLPLDPRWTGPGTERRWADAIAAALHDAVDSGQAVHYSSECDALADLMASAAVANFGNDWAWQEFGLVDAAVSGDPGPAVLAAFGRHPELALPAMSAALGRSGVAAVHRLLRPAGWLELAQLVYQAYAGRRPPAWLASPGAADSHGAAGAGPAGGPEPASSVARPAPDVAARISRIADGDLARRFRQARIRPDTGTALAWAVLAAAAGDQGLLLQPAAEAELLQLAAALIPGGVPVADRGNRVSSRAAGPAPGAAGPGQVTAGAAGNGQATADAARTAQVTAGDARAATGSAAAADGSTTAERADREPGGRSPDAGGPAREPSHDNGRPGWPSAWAGVLHLYRTADDADVPAALLADAALTARPLAWVLHAVACQLVPAAPDDPAVLAFAGLLPTDEPPSRAWRPADKAELDSVAGHARRWLAVTAQRLWHDGTATAETVERLLHREGTLVAERGWIDVEMPISEVDIDIRRAGLDIDPGWIGWLGSVVKFRYV